jgi:hypothetical protein
MLKRSTLATTWWCAFTTTFLLLRRLYNSGYTNFNFELLLYFVINEDILP